MISDLQTSDFDVSLTGFDSDELADLFAKVDKSEVKDDNFDLPKAMEEASFVHRGDVWSLGRHRLVCGDATSEEDVKILMDGRKANLILTNPPYHVSVKNARGLTIQNDSMKSGDFYEFLLKSFKNMAESLENNGSAYIFHADTEGINFRKVFVDAGFYLSGVIHLGQKQFFFRKVSVSLEAQADTFRLAQIRKTYVVRGKKRNEHLEFRYCSQKQYSEGDDHPTMKPLDLLAYPIKNSCQVNGMVQDLFGGSGSTLIACEQTDRICFMIGLMKNMLL